MAINGRLEVAMKDINLQDATNALESHHLSEAERLFYNVLRDALDETKAETNLAPDTGQRTSAPTPRVLLHLQALDGLAEVFLKLAKANRHEEFTWYSYTLQALTLWKNIVDLLTDKNNTSLITLDSTSLENLKTKAEYQLKVVERSLTQAFRNGLAAMIADEELFIEERQTKPVNVEWLEALEVFVFNALNGIANQQSANTSNFRGKLRKGNNAFSSEENSVEDSLSIESKRKKMRDLDFDKIQNTIMTAVRQISSDMRKKSLRSKIPEALLKQSVSSELLSKIHLETEEMGIVGIFEQHIKGYQQRHHVTDSSNTSDYDANNMTEQWEYIPFPGSTYLTNDSNSHGDKPYHDKRLQRVLDNNVINSEDSRVSGLRASNSMPDFRRGGFQLYEFDEASINEVLLPSDIDGIDFTCWRYTSKAPRTKGCLVPHSRLRCFEEKSPITETRKAFCYKARPLLEHVTTGSIATNYCLLSSVSDLKYSTGGLDKESKEGGIQQGQDSTNQAQDLNPNGKSNKSETAVNSEQRSNGVLPVVPLSILPENNLRPITDTMMCLTFGNVLAKVAQELWTKRHELDNALLIYRSALGFLLESCCTSPKQSSPSRTQQISKISQVVQSIGQLKCSSSGQGFECGIQLMEEALWLKQHSDTSWADNQTASIFYELGNAFLPKSTRQDMIMESIMTQMNDQSKEGLFENDIADISNFDEVTEDGDDDDESEHYNVDLYEAISHYNHALALLARLRRQQRHENKLYANCLLRLGDCSIINGNYDRAMVCYEDALSMQKEATGADAIRASAHALSMLGAVNFLMGNHPRAVQMLETSHALERHVYGLEPGIEVAFTLTMLGSSYFVTNQYHRCIAWFLQAYDLLKAIEPNDETNPMKNPRRWFACHCLFLVGYSYATLKFNDKALYHLEVCKTLIENAPDKDEKQLVRVTKEIADVYSLMNQHEKALEYYNEALKRRASLVEKEGSSRAANNSLQKQLMNKVAGAEVSLQRYAEAGEYLDKAFEGKQVVAEESSKRDLVNMLHQLGVSYTLAEDLDRAIECYGECIETFEKSGGSATDNASMSKTYANFALLHHIKSRDEEDLSRMSEQLIVADTFYQRASTANRHSNAPVLYANFLHQQGEHAEAVLAIMPIAHLTNYPLNDSDLTVTYNSVEQTALPEHLREELSEADEVLVDTRVLALFLALLSYKKLRLTKDADDVLIGLLQEVYWSRLPLNHVILAYAFMEMGLHFEAGKVFKYIWRLQRDPRLARLNKKKAALCILTAIYKRFLKGLRYLLEYAPHSRDSRLVHSIPPSSGFWRPGGKIRVGESVVQRSRIATSSPENFRHFQRNTPDDPRFRGTNSATGSGKTRSILDADYMKVSKATTLPRNFNQQQKQQHRKPVEKSSAARSSNLGDSDEPDENSDDDDEDMDEKEYYDRLLHKPALKHWQHVYDKYVADDNANAERQGTKARSKPSQASISSMMSKPLGRESKSSTLPTGNKSQGKAVGSGSRQDKQLTTISSRPKTTIISSRPERNLNS